ncbi:Plant intracellular Ras-group-related LRR protein 9 [Durusdinium trenchii]|uniref:Plant intracellular Ras-group-related LRR protein 9 n=1 Tax=Durusdinium trenchii TaxID=1381693 RepID=A0ABP0IM64_9DINO
MPTTTALARDAGEEGQVEAREDARWRAIQHVPELGMAIREGQASKMLHLGFMDLRSVPGSLFAAGAGLRELVRLDLSNNDLVSLPEEIGMLEKLDQLWVQNNPGLAALPETLAKCTRLRLIDARNTSLATIPAAIGTLDRLFLIDLRLVTTLDVDTMEAYSLPASAEEEQVEEEVVHEEEKESVTIEEPTHAKEASAENGVDQPQGPDELNAEILEQLLVQTEALKGYLRHKFEIGSLKRALHDRFTEGIYRQVAETPEGLEQIKAIVHEVFACFEEIEDLRDVIRNCDRLFPEKIAQVRVRKISAKYLDLKRQNERKKLAAKLELKLRAIYFDRIDPAIVEGIVKGIYSQLETLDDIKFLIRHAKDILPENAADITGPKTRSSLYTLREKLAAERAAGIALVEKALRLLYSHVEPEQIRALTDAACKHFSNTEDLKKLAADASQIFPAEFESGMTDPRSIRRAFRDAQEATARQQDMESAVPVRIKMPSALSPPADRTFWSHSGDPVQAWQSLAAVGCEQLFPGACLTQRVLQKLDCAHHEHASSHVQSQAELAGSKQALSVFATSTESVTMRATTTTPPQPVLVAISHRVFFSKSPNAIAPSPVRASAISNLGSFFNFDPPLLCSLGREMRAAKPARFSIHVSLRHLLLLRRP